ncbi:MAG: permease [Hoeflea sp.]|uniref:permease n=1 Tax=Hoeflea sp. TaxID=1940281 RepID=UPI0032ED3777
MTHEFFAQWHAAARTSTGLFWMAFWAFGLGYLISSMIQVFVTEAGMKRSMGEAGPRSVALASFFGFISSSCSFAALATTRSLFAKGAGLVPSLAFLLASTNLVVELGIIIAVFLSWQFVVGEYLGGILLILLMWVIVRLTAPEKLIEAARQRARDQEGGKDGDVPDWRSLIRRREGWRRVAQQYFMEWAMVWKDVTIGFTVAGIVAVFIPRSFFEWLFVGSGSGDLGFLQLLQHSLIGPVAAFFTFIGSMGNIPLAAVLFSNGVSFAGVMAFIFADLVVFPVLRIQARYYGWRFAFYVLGVFLATLVTATIALHYGFQLAGLLPDPSAARSATDRNFFAVDYKLLLNIASFAVSLILVVWKARTSGIPLGWGSDVSEKILFVLTMFAFVWLLGGWLVAPQLAA